MVIDPKISLAIDNCFASKRWTRPGDWMPLIAEMGITQVEASADTECDPLYMGEEYIKDWIKEVKQCSEKTGVKVVNLYSGHGTYSTLGLAHTDPGVRLRFRDRWLKAQAYTASQLNAGMGFFAHAINDPALQEPEEYRNYVETLYEDLANIAVYASETGMGYIGVEQMYSPNQPPWTIAGARNLLKEVYKKGKAPFYLTLDLGHMNGQQYFLKPSPEQIAEWIDNKSAGQLCKRIWLGPQKARDIFEKAVSGQIEKKQAIEQIELVNKDYDYLFSLDKDGLVHEWLRNLAGYSPIIHLQQSDGKASPHWPFSEEFNRKGIIRGDEVMLSIAGAYSKEAEEGMPPLCEEIILTLEPFIGTAGNNYDAIEEIRQSAEYWRKYVPEDGMKLSEIVRIIENSK